MAIKKTAAGALSALASGSRKAARTYAQNTSKLAANYAKGPATSKTVARPGVTPSRTRAIARPGMVAKTTKAIGTKARGMMGSMAKGVKRMASKRKMG